MLTRRIPKDIEMLKKNQDDLASKGIYFHFFDDDLTKMLALITPRPKSDAESGLISPYTGGFFLFQLSFPEDFPMSPPKLTFHPQASSCRFHPNYYTSGKVCLSIINTWGNADWSPSMSIMALLVTLEERFFEKALGCEPGFERAPTPQHKQYNDIVEYYKYTIAIIDVVKDKYPIYHPFKNIIIQEYNKTKEWHKARISELIPNLDGKSITSPSYHCKATFNYTEVLNSINRLSSQ